MGDAKDEFSEDAKIRIAQNLLAAAREAERLERMSPRELIAETLKSEAADYAVVAELMNRVFPGWTEKPDDFFEL